MVILFGLTFHWDNGRLRLALRSLRYRMAGLYRWCKSPAGSLHRFAVAKAGHIGCRARPELPLITTQNGYSPPAIPGVGDLTALPGRQIEFRSLRCPSCSLQRSSSWRPWLPLRQPVAQPSREYRDRVVVIIRRHQSPAIVRNRHAGHARSHINSGIYRGELVVGHGQAIPEGCPSAIVMRSFGPADSGRSQVRLSATKCACSGPA